MVNDSDAGYQKHQNLIPLYHFLYHRILFWWFRIIWIITVVIIMFVLTCDSDLIDLWLSNAEGVSWSCCLHCFLQRHPSGQRLKDRKFSRSWLLTFAFTFSVFEDLSMVAATFTQSSVQDMLRTATWYHVLLIMKLVSQWQANIHPEIYERCLAIPGSYNRTEKEVRKSARWSLPQ